MKYKYNVRYKFGLGRWCSFYSNSRNARKHLLETGADKLMIFDMNGNVICSACRMFDCILVGTREKGE